MRYSTSCTSQNDIYRSNVNIANNNYGDRGYTTNVALHFNSDAYFRFLHIDSVNNEMDRLCKQTYWIHKLETLHPNGMNSKLRIILSRLADIVCPYIFFIYVL